MSDELSADDIKDLTKAREERCRPVVQEIKSMLMDKGLLLSDLTYLESYVKQELDVMLRGIVFQHLNEIFNMLQGDLEVAVANAQSSLWGKPKDEVSVKDVDEQLNKDVPKEVPKEK